MFFSKKITPVPLDQVEIDLGMRPDHDHVATLEHFAGHNDEPQYNCSGVPVQIDGVLLRTYKADPYRLMVRIGGEWYHLATIREEALGPIQGKIIEYGQRPDEIEKQRQRDEEAKARNEREQREKERAAERGRKRRRAGILQTGWNPDTGRMLRQEDEDQKEKEDA